MDIDRRTMIGAAAVTLATGGTACGAQTSGEIFQPEDFGARGDGISNDTAALAAMSAAVNRAGGGTVVLRDATYVVGRQRARRDSPDWSFEPASILEFRDLVRPLVIQGNGARLKCESGLRYGTFDSATGRSVKRSMPNFAPGQRATPYVAMIFIAGCRAPIEISDLELNGSVAQLRLGGPWGDTGHQILATGMFLRNNQGSETLRNLHIHHQAQDGVVIDGDHRRRARSRFENVISEYNGRQGASIVGGRGYDFLRCKFNHTGRSAVSTAPGAGVDLEAEGKLNRDFTFTDCEFANNSGPGMIADSGDTVGCSFNRCTFVGTTSWSAWAMKPNFRFGECTFIGALSNMYGDRDPNRAARFIGCNFLDAPRETVAATVYLGGGGSGTIANLSDRANILFDRCRFELTRGGQLPWSVAAVYRDCVMNQRSPAQSFPRGTYLGENVINGNAVLTGSRIQGTAILNGKRITNVRVVG